MLGTMLELKQINKIYNAIILGNPKNTNVIDTPINGKTALTKITILKTIKSKKFNTLSLVELSPVTGRTHQLRIHMSENGTPILGDKEYGSENLNLFGKGLFLSATQISFKHPITKKEISLNTDIPNKFKKIIGNTQ